MTICDYLLPTIDLTIISVKKILAFSLDHIIERGTCIWKIKDELYSIFRSTLHSDTLSERLYLRERGFREWKMVSSGSVQLEGPSPKNSQQDLARLA